MARETTQHWTTNYYTIRDETTVVTAGSTLLRFTESTQPPTPNRLGSGSFTTLHHPLLPKVHSVHWATSIGVRYHSSHRGSQLRLGYVPPVGFAKHPHRYSAIATHPPNRRRTATNWPSVFSLPFAGAPIWAPVEVGIDDAERVDPGGRWY